MSTGVLFCDLIAKLEREEMRGVERHPKQKGAKLHNINKCLEVLRERKNISPRYLWSSDDIVQQNVTVIWGILDDVLTDYGMLSNGRKASGNNKSNTKQ